MEQDFAHSLTRLGRDQILRVRNARGRCIVVFQGMAWVTQEGDPRDRLITGGETFTLDRNGVALIHALEPTSLVLLASDAPAAVTIVEAAPLLPWEPRTPPSREHIYRRARRLRALAHRRAWLRVMSFARDAWSQLFSTGPARTVRRVRSSTPARLHSRAGQFRLIRG